MRVTFPVPKEIPLEEVQGKLGRLGRLNDLRVWRIKRYYIITKEHTEAKFETNFSPVMTGFLYTGKNPRICFRLSRTGFAGFHWPGVLFAVLLFVILTISAHQYAGIPMWLIVTATIIILAGFALVTFGFSCTQGGDYVLTHMKEFLNELEQELKKVPS